MESSTSLVKIFVSSRNDDDIVLRLEKLPNLWIEAADNAGDIERFVQKEVIRCKEDGDLFRGSVTDELLEKIVSSLTTRSQGMFLWADLQIKHIYMRHGYLGGYRGGTKRTTRIFRRDISRDL